MLLGVIFALPNSDRRSTCSRPARLGAEAADDARPRPAGRLAYPAAKSTARTSINERLQTTRATRSAPSCATPRSAIPASTGSGHTSRSASASQPQLEDAKTALAVARCSRSPPACSAQARSPNCALEEPEPGLLRYTLTDDGIDYRLGSAVTQSIEVVGRRVNELGTTEPIIQRQGNDRILVQVPGLQDPQRLKDILGQTAKLTFQMVDQTMPVQEAIDGRPPAGSTMMYSTDDPPVPYLIEDRVIVSGENLVDAQATFDQQHQRAGRHLPLRHQGRAALRRRRRSRMSASCSRSCSTTR